MLILDETTADIDPITEHRIADALDSVGAGRTLIVVAHRPETADRAGRRVVVAGGRIVAHPAAPTTPPRTKETP